MTTHASSILVPNPLPSLGPFDHVLSAERYRILAVSKEGMCCIYDSFLNIGG